MINAFARVTKKGVDFDLHVDVDGEDRKETFTIDGFVVSLAKIPAAIRADLLAKIEMRLLQKAGAV